MTWHAARGGGAARHPDGRGTAGVRRVIATPDRGVPWGVTAWGWVLPGGRPRKPCDSRVANSPVRATRGWNVDPYASRDALKPLAGWGAGEPAVRLDAGSPGGVLRAPGSNEVRPQPVSRVFWRWFRGGEPSAEGDVTRLTEAVRRRRSTLSATPAPNSRFTTPGALIRPVHAVPRARTVLIEWITGSPPSRRHRPLRSPLFVHQPCWRECVHTGQRHRSRRRRTRR